MAVAGVAKKNALLYGWFGGKGKGFLEAEVLALFGDSSTL